MEKLLNILFRLFAQVWVLHWKESGPANIGVHNTLDALYTDLKAFIDEFAETRLSTGVKFEELLPLSSNIDKLPTIEGVRKNLEDTRALINELDKDPIYSDLFGRIVASMNHYIFMLSFKDESLVIFSNKANNALVSRLRKLFKSQNEFLTRFNSYLKGNKDPEKDIYDFFRNNEHKLIDLQEDIYKANTKLFSLRDEVDETAISNYNNLVKFFDLFID